MLSIIVLQTNLSTGNLPRATMEQGQGLAHSKSDTDLVNNKGEADTKSVNGGPNEGADQTVSAMCCYVAVLSRGFETKYWSSFPFC